MPVAARIADVDRSKTVSAACDVVAEYAVDDRVGAVVDSDSAAVSSAAAEVAAVSVVSTHLIAGDDAAADGGLVVVVHENATADATVTVRRLCIETARDGEAFYEGAVAVCSAV